MKTERQNSCPVCGKSPAELSFTGRDSFYGVPGDFSVYRCTACDHAFVSPVPDREELAGHYPESYYSFRPESGLPSAAACENPFQCLELVRKGYRSAKFPMTSFFYPLYRLLRGERLRVGFRPLPQGPAKGRLLDAGCGSGFYLSEMKKLGWDVQGVEISRAAADSAARHYGVPVFCGELEQAPFSDAEFDVITLWEALEHLPDPRRTLAKLHRLLKPGGRLLGSVPNRRSWYGRVFGPDYLHWDLPRHLQHFSAESLRQALSETGFREIRTGTYSTGADTILLSRELRRSRLAGGKVAEDFWEKKKGSIGLLHWLLKPVNWAADAARAGITLEFEAVK